MIALLLTQALAAEAPPAPLSTPDALEAALVAEVQENLALTLGNAPPIYHLRYHLLALDSVSVESSLGSLVQVSASPYNILGVEVRVGSPEYDNTGFGGWQNGFSRTALPVDLTDYTARLGAWRITDQAYKQSIEQFARKQAQFTPPDTYPGDYTLKGATVGQGEIPAADSQQDLATLATRLSGAFLGDAALERGEVFIGHEAGFHLIVDSEGTRVRRPRHETTVRGYAHLRAPDGMLLTDQRLWTVKGLADLPPTEELVAEMQAVRDGLVQLAEAKPLAEEYVGPVILEEGAAADLFRYLLTPQLEGTPEEVPFDSWFGELGESKDPVRVGRRVLPEGWAVLDDPTADTSFPGSYTHDFEGTPAQRVSLVESGIVRRVLMSRIPRQGVQGTTGSARSLPGYRANARVSHLQITPPKQLSRKKLRRRALKIAATYGRDWVLVIRRLQEPSVRNAGQGFLFFGSDDEAALTPPVAVLKVYADGREEWVRGARFAGIQRFVLRDIVAAGPSVTVDYLGAVDGDASNLGPTEGLPTRIEAVEVLIGEVELVPAPGDPQSVPLLSLPTLDR